MLLTLIRDHFTPAETLGKLYIDRKPFCDTIEPPSVPNAQHPKGCIPVGWYKVQVTRSPKFGRPLPLLCYVLGFEGIRIHAGNTRDHTSGCILVGKGSWDTDNSSDMSDQSELSCLSDLHTIPTLFRSRATEQALTKLLIKVQNEREEIYIDVTDSDRYLIERSVLDRL